ncbi:hypothetical protein COCNU_01G005600 [Cocos nucifera]|uniref:Trafficking protein particle complex II-specific subunit 120 homolog n=1 Tax=Cocos nucifera TaxID=13894 RepID=A0A8K0HU33_COCNU|nr:hypothetical protein COCNU_01G005600 [Cocos nucifera]
MEPDVSMETGSMIRIAVLPVGGAIPHHQLREYAAMLGRHTRIDLSSISSFYKEHQKSPFAHQPWETGCLRFKYMLGGAPPSPWEDFQSCRKILAVVGLCHCPSSPDLDLVDDQFAAACKGYSSALAKRCFAFFPTDSQHNLVKKPVQYDVDHNLYCVVILRSNSWANIRSVPPKDSVCNIMLFIYGFIIQGQHWDHSYLSQEHLVNGCIERDLLKEFKVIKAKKRRLGRAQKTIGDYCLLAGSPLDANAHYSTAIELARLTGDVFWHAGALEGSVCALLADSTVPKLFDDIGKEKSSNYMLMKIDFLCLQLDCMDQKDPVLEEEVKYRYYTVIQLYRRSYLQDNAQRYCWSRKLSVFPVYTVLISVSSWCELAKEVVELLMGAADGAKSLIDASDRLILYVEIARLFGTLGYQRKAAFFSRQVAQLYLQQDNACAAISAMQVLTMTSNAYHVQSRRASSKLQTSHHVVESIYLSVHSGNFDAFPLSVSLPPNTAKVILLSGIPTKVGPVSIPGCIVHCFGVITEHLFKDVDNLLLGAAQGLVLSDPFRCCGSGKLKNVSIPNISVVPALPLLVSHVVGGDGATVLYEGEIRDIWISLTNAGTVPVEQAHIALSGKNQDSVISIAHDTLMSALPLKPGGEVTLPVTLKAWQLSMVDSEIDSSKSSGSTRRISKEGSSPLLVIHYAGSWTHSDQSNNTENSVPPGRRLVVPLNVCVLQGLRFVKARLLSMEIPARISEVLPKPLYVDKNPTEVVSRDDSMVKIDPYRGSWELRLLELELSNPTDVVFEVNVSVQLDNHKNEHGMPILNHENADLGYPKTRIDRDYSARVLIPLEHFKLPILDGSFFAKDSQTSDAFCSKVSNMPERSAKAELNASINNLISKIKVRWHSGRNSSGELNIKDATQPALQASVMDILLPDPLTFGFRLAKNGAQINGFPEESIISDDPPSQCVNGNVIKCKGSISAHEMTHMEVLVRNNTREMIQMSLSVTCRDVAGENCMEGNNATVLWAGYQAIGTVSRFVFSSIGVLNDIPVEVPALEEVKHAFSLYFLVPGEYTLLAASVINDATDVLRARARTDSPDEPIFCRGSPFHVYVVGTA